MINLLRLISQNSNRISVPVYIDHNGTRSRYAFSKPIQIITRGLLLGLEASKNGHHLWELNKIGIKACQKKKKSIKT